MILKAKNARSNQMLSSALFLKILASIKDKNDIKNNPFSVTFEVILMMPVIDNNSEDTPVERQTMLILDKAADMLINVALV